MHIFKSWHKVTLLDIIIGVVSTNIIITGVGAFIIRPKVIIEHQHYYANDYNGNVLISKSNHKSRTYTHNSFLTTTNQERQLEDLSKTDLKNNIRNLAKDTKNGIDASQSTKDAIQLFVKRLEQLAQNENVGSGPPNYTSNEQLNGTWNLIYTTNGGSSAGKLGPFVGDVEQRIFLSTHSLSSSATSTRSSNDGDGNENRNYYINCVRLGDGIVEGALTADWDVLSETEWQVNFKAIVFKVFGITLLEKDLDAKGIWSKTYLDDDFRILYASSVSSAPNRSRSSSTSRNDGIDEDKNEDAVKENIYILSK